MSGYRSRGGANDAQDQDSRQNSCPNPHKAKAGPNAGRHAQGRFRFHRVTCAAAHLESPTARISPGQSIYHFVHDPRGDGRTFLAASNGWFGSDVHRSSDAGRHWRKQGKGPPSRNAYLLVLRGSLRGRCGRPLPVSISALETGQLFGSGTRGRQWQLLADFLPPILCRWRRPYIERGLCGALPWWSYRRIVSRRTGSWGGFGGKPGSRSAVFLACARQLRV